MALVQRTIKLKKTAKTNFCPYFYGFVPLIGCIFGVNFVLCHLVNKPVIMIQNRWTKYIRSLVLGLSVLFFPLLVIGQNRPNIIVILSDDGGYEDFGCYGGTDVHTPHIDHLAQQGVLFRSAYATASVCAPSRAGLLTGRYQQRFGFEHNISKLPAEGVKMEDIGMDVSVKTIGDQLRYNGYKTIAIGKWHQGDYEPYFPLNRGFDHFFGFIGGHRSYFGIERQKVNDEYVLYDDRKVVSEREITYLTEDLTNKALGYIDRYKSEPFFIYLSYNAVHTPMEATYRSYQKYAHVTDTLRRTYLAMLDDMDTGIGRIVDRLKQQGLYENTMIFFLNDNGAATNNGADNGILRGLKGSKWEGGIRVPLIMQWPKHLPAGVQSASLVSTMDILPTCIALAGGKILPDQKIDGKNLLESYRSPEKGHAELFWRRGVAKAVRHKDWKMIAVDTQPVLLFDLSTDQTEQTNVAAEHPEVCQRLLSDLAKWEEEMQDPKWFSPYGDYNQLMKHRMEVVGREMERLYP